MREKTIGIVGGMGPEATVDCFAKIIKNTSAQKDQEHLRVLIDSNPKVPDRTAAILGKGESPVPVIVEGCRAMARARADFIIIPCVSAHFFIEEIRNQVELPILSIFDAVADAVVEEHPEMKTVGLMATTGTVRGGLFQKRLAEEAVETIVPEDPVQEKIMAAIYDIKSAKPNRSRTEISADLTAAAEGLVARKPAGAEGIIAGCTEIPIALKAEHLSVPYFDVLTILARAAIRQAGRTPIPIP